MAEQGTDFVESNDTDSKAFLFRSLLGNTAQNFCLKY
jgi:hypothetical protein